MRQMLYQSVYHVTVTGATVTGKAEGVANKIADREGSKTRKEAEEMSATGVDTTKIRVQNVDIHPRAYYVRTVQYETRER